MTQVYIGGRFRPSDDVTPVIEAATGEPLGDGANASAADIDDAVAAARSALPGWRATPPAARADLLRAMAAALKSRARATNELVTRENGMPMSLSRGANGAFPALLLNYYAKLITELPDEEVRPSAIGHTIVRREPVGVVAAITPWNYPQALAAFKLAPALAAGCTVILKPSPETALDAMVFGEAATEAGLPAGVLNIVPGGVAAGAYLVAHPGVDKVSFTGSTAAGRAIGETCGRLLRPVTLELGGKSAAIILDDADLDVTIAGLRTAVVRQQRPDVLPELADPRAAVPLRRGRRRPGHAGRQHDRRRSAGSGHRHRAGGQRTATATRSRPYRCRHRRRRQTRCGRIDSEGSDLGAGSSSRRCSPTCTTPTGSPRRRSSVPCWPSSPTTATTKRSSLANDSEYGLGGTVWSADTERATEVARAVETGTIGVNAYNLDVAAPFGGVKASGLGRELGPEGLDAYRVLKSIYRTGEA